MAIVSNINVWIFSYYEGFKISLQNLAWILLLKLFDFLNKKINKVVETYSA